MLERDYQMDVVRKLYDGFRSMGYMELRDVIVYINDPNYIQGIPDLSVFFRPTARFAMLEVKTSAKAPVRPNQQWYIDMWGQNIFTAFIYPENEQEVLLALQRSLVS